MVRKEKECRSDDMIMGNPVKYELTDEELLNLYYMEPRLAALMELDVFRLIDGHLVVNLREFITPKTQRLTAYAKRNLPACCIGIQYVPLGGQAADNRQAISCTLDILIQSASFLENGNTPDGEQSDEEQQKESSKIDDEIARINKILNSLPGSFSGSLKALMESKGYTEELLAEESWVSLSTIKQYRQKEDKVKTLKTVIAICIGLHLHPWITEDLIRKAGLTIKATRLDGAYRYLYTFHYKDSIDDCNVYLRAQKLPEFKMNEKAA